MVIRLLLPNSRDFRKLLRRGRNVLDNPRGPRQQGAPLMSRFEKPGNPGLDAAMKVIGGKWKAQILYSLGDEARRFGELRRQVGGISERMLVLQLRELELEGLVLRRDYQQVPPRVEYRITPLGASLVDALRVLDDWGRRHGGQIGLPPRVMEDE